MALNGISTLQYKHDRQQQKLEIAAAKRAATGRRANLDITQLPTIYADGDNDTGHVVNNPNDGGLVIGRPWTANSPPPPISSPYTVRQWLGEYVNGSNSSLYVLLADYPSALQIPVGATAAGLGSVTSVTPVSYFGTPTAQLNISPYTSIHAGDSFTFTW